MAFEQPLGKLGMIVAGADLSAKQFYAVKLNSSSKAVLSGAGEQAIGILQNDPVSDMAADIMYAGVSKAVAGASIAAGDLLMSNASGKLIPLTSTNISVAVALAAASADEVVSVLLTNNGGGGGISPAYSTVSFPVNLASVANGNIVTSFVPGFAGTIEKLQFVTSVPVTTAAKATTLNAEIAGVDVTGGVVALTSANCTPIGATVQGSAVTAAKSFGATDAIDIEASSTTAFVEGAGVLILTLKSA